MSSKPLQILMSFPTAPLTDWLPSGDGLLAHRIITELAERGHSIHVATPYAALRDSFPKHVTVHQMNKHADEPRPGKLRYMAWTRRLLKELRATNNFDLIHELNPVFSLLSLAFAGSGIPVVLGPHSSRWPLNADGRYPWPKALRRRAAHLFKDICVREQHRRASAILVSTQAALNNVSNPERHVGRLFLLPPGIDAQEFSPDKSGADNGSPTVLFLANVVVRKGIFTLLEAFEHVSKRVPNARLVIAGDGPSLPVVKQKVEASSYRDRVEFLGRVGRADVRKVLGRCSVYCLPSHGEPFGITAVEAMACGKPLVVTDAGGLGYMVSEQGGRQVPVRDAAALARALTELLQDPKLCQTMGEHNRRQSEIQYAWPRVASRLEEIYWQILGRGSSAHSDRLESADIAEYQRRKLPSVLQSTGIVKNA